MKFMQDFRQPPMDAQGLRLTEPKRYKQFLDVALSYADTICMTYHGSFQDFQASPWAFLNESILGHEVTNHTPVTIGPPVCLIYFHIDRTTRAWLMGREHIYDFVCSGDAAWFDDFCLAKDGAVVFCSCTHEAFCSIHPALSHLLQ